MIDVQEGGDIEKKNACNLQFIKFRCNNIYEIIFRCINIMHIKLMRLGCVQYIKHTYTKKHNNNNNKRKTIND